jgi:hypothetical protein
MIERDSPITDIDIWGGHFRRLGAGLLDVLNRGNVR